MLVTLNIDPAASGIVGLLFMIICLPLYHFDNIMNLLSLEHLINEPRVLVWFILEWIGLCVIVL